MSLRYESIDMDRLDLPESQRYSPMISSGQNMPVGGPGFRSGSRGKELRRPLFSSSIWLVFQQETLLDSHNKGVLCTIVIMYRVSACILIINDVLVAAIPNELAVIL